MQDHKQADTGNITQGNTRAFFSKPEVGFSTIDIQIGQMPAGLRSMENSWKRSGKYSRMSS